MLMNINEEKRNATVYRKNKNFISTMCSSLLASCSVGLAQAWIFLNVCIYMCASMYVYSPIQY